MKIISLVLFTVVVVLAIVIPVVVHVQRNNEGKVTGGGSIMITRIMGMFSFS